jgi:signal transduction histidine kinase
MPPVRFDRWPPLSAGMGLLASAAARLTGVSGAVCAERLRIAQDLHDGIGFQLTTALWLARQGPGGSADLPLALELAIVELHSIVHVLRSPGVKIVDAMASLRYRLQPMLERRGVELIWEVDNDIAQDVLQEPAAHHFIRIVQEAFSNVLHHSQATRLEVRLRQPHPRTELLLEVVDNGRGLASLARAPDAASRGTGLAGMQRRAAFLGGALELRDRPEGGTHMRLAVPLPCALR